jgi:hypothetical protein
MRMALDLGLHRALEKLADQNGKRRSDEEERDLGKLRAGFGVHSDRDRSHCCPHLALFILA